MAAAGPRHRDAAAEPGKAVQPDLPALSRRCRTGSARGHVPGHHAAVSARSGTDADRLRGPHGWRAGDEPKFSLARATAAGARAARDGPLQPDHLADAAALGSGGVP